MCISFQSYPFSISEQHVLLEFLRSSLVIRAYFSLKMPNKIYWKRGAILLDSKTFMKVIF